MARLRTDIARACLELGDREGASRELDAAENGFRSLGAEPDLARVQALRARQVPSSSDTLTDRERHVLSLVADGSTNKQIASELSLSPKTVNRHVENIFGKLGVSSRAAAVAKGLKTGSI